MHFFYQNITQSIVLNIKKVAIQQTVFEPTAVVVKHKFIKRMQSVEGSVISQIFDATLLKLEKWG